MVIFYFYKKKKKGLGDYFSSSAEIEQAKSIRKVKIILKKKCLWNCEKNPEEQKQILREVFENKGFGKEESEKIVHYFSENTQTFADIVLLEKEGIR
jgi:hypothetical protein